MASASLAPLLANEPDAAGDLQKIGVVSVAGDQLFQIHIGQLAFGNAEERSDIRDWTLDDEWEGQLVAAGTRLNGIKLVDLAIDRQPIYDAYPDVSERTVIRKERDLDFERAVPALQKIAEDAGVDALLVISSTFRHIDPLYLEGTTLVTEKSFAGRNAFYWLLIEASLVDGATGKRFANRRIGKNGSMVERAPKELRPKRFSDYSSEEVSFLREQFRRMPEPYWGKALDKLFSGAN
jgi:hypothetical protein